MVHHRQPARLPVHLRGDPRAGGAHYSAEWRVRLALSRRDPAQCVDAGGTRRGVARVARRMTHLTFRRVLWLLLVAVLPFSRSLSAQATSAPEVLLRLDDV